MEKMSNVERRLDKDLLELSAYPEQTKKVELVQTHISLVFITDNFVYKVKKPVNFGFLDFSSLEKRKYYCQQEVMLNKRLSPEIYLSVVPVVDKNGRFVFGGEGNIVDYAVKMERIPTDRIMSRLLKENKLTEQMIEAVGEKIAEFHKTAETSSEISKFGEIAVIKTNTDENFEQTEKYVGVTIARHQFEMIKNYTNNFYQSKHKIFNKRIADSKIKDCHGDLHMEHICILMSDPTENAKHSPRNVRNAPHSVVANEYTRGLRSKFRSIADKIIIFDCIEFNERFRYSDTAADIAFLAMDLDYHGRRDLSNILINSYIKFSGDDSLPDMLDFYKIYRAYVRGKVISFKLDDPFVLPRDKELAGKNAKKYFKLAEYYVKND